MPQPSSLIFQVLVYMDELRITTLEVAKGDADPKREIAHVSFCEGSASLQVGEITIHIPWTELADWNKWLAWRVEQEAP